MARLKFESDSRVEWIYRGSTRLAPLFKEMEKQKLIRAREEEMSRQGAAAFTRRTTSGQGRRHIIQWQRDGGEADPSSDQAGSVSDGGAVKKPVARKSTTNTKKSEQSSAARLEFEGNVFDTEINPPPRQKFRVHNCSPRCLADNRYKYNERDFFRCVNTDNPNNDKDLKNYNPLLIPVMLGWTRQVTKHRLHGKMKKLVVYTAPCGRCLRSLAEVHRYLT